MKYKKGLVLLIGKNHNDAIKQFHQVIEQDPEYALAYEGLGRAFSQKKDYEAAKERLAELGDQG